MQRVLGIVRDAVVGARPWTVLVTAWAFLLITRFPIT
jgi:hypothetical protein